jgi:predicted glycoside hydrolase/deacetylase ChbG (UPF0249 family)
VDQRRIAIPILLAACCCLAGALPAQQAAPAPGATVQERLGYPASARLLVLHADDLGMSRSVNRATFEALENGWITSASILVPCPWFPEVAAFARTHPELDLGIHLALNSEWTGYRWGPVSDTGRVPSLLDEQGYLPLVEGAVVARAAPGEVEIELRAQIDRAKTAGIRLTHLDSHMGTLFRSPALFEVYRGLGAAYDLPLLLEREGDRNAPASAARDQALLDQVLSISPGVAASGWLDAYREMLAPLPPGVYQLIVHLGYDDEEMRGATWDHPDWGAAWRQSDFDLVRSDAFRSFLREQGFVLVDWEELSRARRSR